MNNKNQLSFSTKRNMLTNSADFYNLSYDYINDCLKAGIVFRREFYTDRDVEPENNLIKQYIELIGTEGITLHFKEEAISEIALIATKVNEEVENIGARRLHTILEKILEDISFNASEKKASDVDIDAKYVKDQIGDIYKDIDLTKFIL